MRFKLVYLVTCCSYDMSYMKMNTYCIQNSTVINKYIYSKHCNIYKKKKRVQQ